MARPKEFDPDVALDRAVEVFWAEGYEATSMQDLVEAMGINRGSLYGTFGGKRALFLAALDRYLEGQVVRFEEALAEGTSAGDAIRRAFTRVAAMALGDERRGCLLTNCAVEIAPRCAETTRRVQASLRRLERALAAVVARGQESGEVPATHAPSKQARALLATLQGLVVLGKAGVGRRVIDDAVAVAAASLESSA